MNNKLDNLNFAEKFTSILESLDMKETADSFKKEFNSNNI